MNNDFDKLLSLHRERPVPALPGSFGDDVRREIRLRSSMERSVWWEDALDLVRRPGAQFAALTAAVLIGLLAPGLHPTGRTIDAAAALGMDVFSSRDSNFPTGLLAFQR